MAFQFKQFFIDDHNCAMKVGTDGTLLGAWCEPPVDAARVLDVGTGSGLLALMLAQRFPNLAITAIEIDKEAAEAARWNVSQSPWSNRIDVQTISLQDYFEAFRSSIDPAAIDPAALPFDAIVCNPPFFANDMKAESINRQLARHQQALPISQLFELSRQLLNSEGTISIVMPATMGRAVVELAQSQQFYLRRQLAVVPLPDRPVKRWLLEFGFQPVNVDYQTILLEEKRHQRSAQYQRLTEDFYLRNSAART